MTCVFYKILTEQHLRGGPQGGLLGPSTRLTWHPIIRTSSGARPELTVIEHNQYLGSPSEGANYFHKNTREPVNVTGSGRIDQSLPPSRALQ